MSTKNYGLILNTNWIAKNETTKQVVAKMKLRLDGRVKVIKEASPEAVDRVLTAFLAYGDMEYQVKLDAVPEEDRDLVEVCKNTLTGEVLQRTSGRTGYKLRPNYVLSYECETITDGPTQSVLQSKHTKWMPSAPQRLLTDYGSTITDQSYHLVPLDRFTNLNFHKVSTVVIPNPYQQTRWIIEQNGPALRWNGVEGQDSIYVLEFDEIADLAVDGPQRGYAVRYRNNSFICCDPSTLLSSLSAATARTTNRAGCSFHSTTKDKWRRKSFSWGVQ